MNVFMFLPSTSNFKLKKDQTLGNKKNDEILGLLTFIDQVPEKIMKFMQIENNDENEEVEVSSSDKNKLSDEIEKLNKLLNDGILTQEEFEKAKKKILDQ